MPMVYDFSLATPGDVTTNATPATETATWSFKSGTRNVALQSMYACGKANALTAISGIIHRIVKFATASTSGTGITPAPKDPGMQAAKATVISGQTLGSTRTNRAIFGHGAGGPNQWIALNADSAILLEGGSGAASIDAVNASNTASMKFEWSGELVE